MWALVLGLLATEPVPLDQALSVAEGSCLSGPALAESTTSWLGRPTVDDAIRVEVYAVGDARVAFRLWTQGELTVERELAPPPAECEARTAAVGLLIALAIDERVSEAVGLVSSPPSVEEVMPPIVAPADEVETAPKLEAAPEPPPTPVRRVPVALGVGAIGSYEVLPGAAIGGRLAVSVRVAPRLDVDVGLQGLGGLPFSLGEGETQPTLAVASASVCPLLAKGRVEARLCLSPLFGLVVAQGRGYPQDEQVVLPWLGAQTSADLRVPVSKRVGLTFEAGVVAPIVGARFDVRNDGGIVQERRGPAAAGVSGGLGVVVHLREPYGSG